MERIVIGTRGSRLSLAQTQIVIDKISKAFPKIKIEIKIIKTHGDIHKDMKLDKAEQNGVFVKEIDRQLIDGEIDLAVHSLKDIPTKQTDVIEIAAIVGRANPRDVLISKGKRLKDLPKGSKVGTSSPRRKGQLLAARNDLNIVEMRGNVDERIAKLDRGQYDAIVLAAAGIERIGLKDRITEYLQFDTMLPAPGQGALAVEIRNRDDKIRKIAEKINDRKISASTDAERVLLSRIGGGCSALLGAYARVDGNKLDIKACVTSENGKRMYKYTQKGSINFPEEAGLTLAEKILTSEAKDLVGDKKYTSTMNGKTVLVTREEKAGEGLCQMLLERGSIPVYFPTIKTEKVKDEKTRKALDSSVKYDAIIITSKKGAEGLLHFPKKQTRIIVIGEETRKQVESYGFSVDYAPEKSYSKSILKGIGDVDGKKILIINSVRSDNSLAEELTAKGAIIERISPYTTIQNEISETRKKTILNYNPDYITFASPSAVDAFVGILGKNAKMLLSKSKVICIGDTTAKKCKEMGIPVAGISQEHTFAGMVRLMEKLLK